MKEWKVSQELYHRTHLPTDWTDGKVVIVSDQPLVPEIVKYFTVELGDVLVYPAKSFAVAMIYSRLLSKYFDEDFYTALNDPALLYNNDQYFVPYYKAIKTYEDAILRVSTIRDAWDVENSPFSQVQATVAYFKQEFLLS